MKSAILPRRRSDVGRDPLKLRKDVKKNSLKRHAGAMAGEIGTSALLLFSILTVTASLIVGCDRIVRSSVFTVRETVVRGLSELTEKDVLSLARVSEGANLLTVNREAISRRICRNEWVKEAFVGREFPNRLVILVKERKAVALIEKDNMLHLVDSNGEMFKKLGPEEKADVPILTGFFSGETLNSGLVGKSLYLLDHLKRAQDNSYLGAVSEIHGDENFGFSIFTDKGLCLKLGFEGYDAKLNGLAAVMDDLEKKNLKTGFMIVDLTNPEKINVQPRTTVQTEGLGNPPANGKKLRI